MDAATGTLSCTLIDRRSSVPVANARVSLLMHHGNKMMVQELDERGHLRIDLPEGVYDLVISARGYLSLLLRGIGVLSGTATEIMRGMVPGEGQSIEGGASTAIGGVLVDRLNHPVANLLVQAQSSEHTYTSRTTRSGHYVIHNVASGEYEVTFRDGERLVHRVPLSVADTKELVRLDERLLHF